MTLRWTGQRRIRQRMAEYERRVIDAVKLLGQYWAPLLERYAKENAPWVDRTGHARQGIQGLVEDMSSEAITSIVLKGGVYYQVFLELANAGRYAIILPTILEHQDKFLRDLKEVVGDGA